jgi:hypothetical protein
MKEASAICLHCRGAIYRTDADRWAHAHGGSEQCGDSNPAKPRLLSVITWRPR